MDHPAVRILNLHSTMAISTVRPDGWPQTTIVGYANRGFDIVFLIYRSSQKFENIQHDDRISIAVASEPADMKQLQAVYAGAYATEISEEGERQTAWKQLMERHANLAGFQIPEPSKAVFMRAKCKYVSMLDFTQGPGHREQFMIGDDGARVEIDVQKDKWGDEAASRSTG